MLGFSPLTATSLADDVGLLGATIEVPAINVAVAAVVAPSKTGSFFQLF